MCHTSTHTEHIPGHEHDTRAKITHKSSSIYRQQQPTHGKGHTNTKKIYHNFVVVVKIGCNIVPFVVVVFWNVGYINTATEYHITTHTQAAANIAYY